MSSSPIISLGAARNVKRLKDNREQILAILDNNRGALKRLFDSGVIFHGAGSRAGRNLLLAHELLLEVLDLIDEIAAEGGGGTRAERLRRLKRLLSRASLLTAKTGEKLKTLLPKDPG